MQALGTSWSDWLGLYQFLRYTTERRLTQQIGGRFRSLHRELLDHFAAMDVEPSKASDP